MAVTDFQQKPDTAVDCTAAALHSLGNGSFATLAEYDASAAGELNFLCDLELVLATGAACTDGNLIDVYFLTALDGTNYPDTGGPPSPLFRANFRVNGSASPQRYAALDVLLPACKLKPYIRNGSGQATSAAGSTFKVFPRRSQGTTA